MRTAFCIMTSLVTDPLANNVLVTVVVCPASDYDAAIAVAMPAPSAVPIAILPGAATVPIPIAVVVPPTLCRSGESYSEKHGSGANKGKRNCGHLVHS